MPYCRPANVWHDQDDTANGTLVWCPGHGQWHHATEQCPDGYATTISAEAFRASAVTPEVCPDCYAHHYGEACPLAVAPCERCGDDHAPADECEYCDRCQEWVAYDHDCPYYDCEYCGDVVSYDESHNCQDGSGCCTSPQLSFTVRNDGAAPLANDTRAEFTLPAGIISQAGLKEIRDYLCGRDNYYMSRQEMAGLGELWQTKDGNYAKRLSRYIYKRGGAKLTPEVMSQVGCIARDHSNAVDVRIEVTRDLNQSASYFYHGDSCYWGGYSESRCVLKSNGGFGLRSFNQYGDVSGRAWVMPLRLDDEGKLGPTFDTMTPDAFVVFNGYGDLSGYAGARIMSHMAGWTYRKINFECEPVYINSGGYLVAPEYLAAKFTDGSLTLDVSQHSSLYDRERGVMSYA